MVFLPFAVAFAAGAYRALILSSIPSGQSFDNGDSRYFLFE
jgi:hypothetical protein